MNGRQNNTVKRVLVEHIAPELGPDEALMWAGQPEPGHYTKAMTSLYEIAFGVIFIAMAIGTFASVISDIFAENLEYPDYAKLVILLFVLPIAYVGLMAFSTPL